MTTCQQRPLFLGPEGGHCTQARLYSQMINKLQCLIELEQSYHFTKQKSFQNSKLEIQHFSNFFWLCKQVSIIDHLSQKNQLIIG